MLVQCGDLVELRFLIEDKVPATYHAAVRTEPAEQLSVQCPTFPQVPEALLCGAQEKGLFSLLAGLLQWAGGCVVTTRTVSEVQGIRIATQLSVLARAGQTLQGDHHWDLRLGNSRVHCLGDGVQVFYLLKDQKHPAQTFREGISFGVQLRQGQQEGMDPGGLSAPCSGRVNQDLFPVFGKNLPGNALPVDQIQSRAQLLHVPHDQPGEGMDDGVGERFQRPVWVGIIGM